MLSEMFLTLKFASSMIAIERKNIPYLWVCPFKPLAIPEWSRYVDLNEK